MTAEVQQAELGELVEVIATELRRPFSVVRKGGRGVGKTQSVTRVVAEDLAQAIVDAQNVFIGASYVKAEAAEGRTVFCILTPAEANALVVFRQTQQTGELDAKPGD